MGTVARFDLKTLAARYGVLHFVETGTGRGDGLAHAAASGVMWLSLRTCDTEPALCEAAADRFRNDPRIHVAEGRSAPFLRKVCEDIPQTQPILFWLDAHFPGADEGIRSWDAEKAETIRLPLAHEMAIISGYRRNGSDMILCDDMRIYVDGAYGHGNLPANLRALCPRDRNLDFIRESGLLATHDFTGLWDHEGYMVLSPKGIPWQG
jgi:hypothetical protein